jgi:hypothetical protein
VAIAGREWGVVGGELAEKQLAVLIERRSRNREVDPDEREEHWKESVRRYNARRREENRLAWCDYFKLRAGGVGSCVLRFFGFPDFVTGL